MYSVAQTSVWVGAHRVPHCSSRDSTACRAKSKEHMLNVRWRVAPPACSHHIQVESVAGRRQLQPGYRIWNPIGRSAVHDIQDLPTGWSGRQVAGVRPGAQAHGEAGGIAEAILHEASPGASVLDSGFVDAGEGGEDDVVASGYGWKVREACRFDVQEFRAVAHVQASSFHIEAAVFDELFFNLFRAEVLSALLYKAKHSPSDRYACLLAEPAVVMDEGESSDGEPAPMIVGAVNLAASNEYEVSRHLHDANEYLYVSGMAVDMKYRRKNVATVLLRACELLAMKWGFDYLALHAYEDDLAARSLYSRGGYRVIALDPLWLSTWMGRKRRVLMAKKTSRTPNVAF